MSAAGDPRAYPHLTVACIVEQEGRFLFVEERVDGALVLNQPAGHVEPAETLPAAARRETLEETGWEVELTALLGTACYTGVNGVSYHRVAFAARPLQRLEGAALDPEIEAVHWLSAGQAQQQAQRMRSPLVLATLRRHLDAQHYPLEFIYS